MGDNLAEDVACASAAYLHNILPEIQKLGATEQYQRLCDVFRTTIAAFIEFRTEIVPSEN